MSECMRPQGLLEQLRHAQALIESVADVQAELESLPREVLIAATAENEKALQGAGKEGGSPDEIGKIAREGRFLVSLLTDDEIRFAMALARSSDF